MRAAIYLRLSNATDESTSIQRQREACLSYATARGFTSGLEYVDDGVSGAREALSRPGLTAALQAAQDGLFDVLIIAKIDRLARSVRVFDEVRLSLESHGVELVSVAEALDMTTPAGRMVATVLASFAAFERERTSERVQESHKALAAAGRYPGHRIPFGWRSEARKDAPGRTLRLDPVRGPDLRRVVDLVIAGEPVSRARRTVGDHLPNETSLRRLLRSQTLLGRIVRQGKVSTDAQGLPLVPYEPLVTLGEWQALQKALDKLAKPSERPKGLPSLLGGLLVCGNCKKTMITHTQRRDGEQHRSYRCCFQMGMELVDKTVEKRFLAAVGHFEVVRVVESPSQDLEALEVARERREAVRRMFVAGLLSEEEAGADLAVLNETIASLEDQPEGVVEEVPTGHTFAEEWKDADLTERRSLLNQALDNVTLKSGKRGDKSRVVLYWR
jgi:site-specific DNA recombinase